MAYRDLPHLMYVAADDEDDAQAVIQEAAVHGFPSSRIAGHPRDILPKYREGRKLWRVELKLPAPEFREVTDKGGEN